MSVLFIALCAKPCIMPIFLVSGMYRDERLIMAVVYIMASQSWLCQVMLMLRHTACNAFHGSGSLNQDLWDAVAT